MTAAALLAVVLVPSLAIAEPVPLLSMTRLSVAVRGQLEQAALGEDATESGYSFGMAFAYCLYDPGAPPRFGNAALISSVDRITFENYSEYRARFGVSLAVYAGK